jgi:hypothetical protein
MNNTELLPIPGWEGLYAVRGDQIISLRSGKALKPGLSGSKHRRYYVVNLCRPGYKQKMMLVHRLVLSAKLGRPIAYGKYADHIDNNQFNNFPENLRELTNQENLREGFALKRKAGKTSTDHRGVTFTNGGYRVHFTIDGIDLYLGWYKDYDVACRIQEDAEAGIISHNAQARLEKLKIKKNNADEKH